MSNPATDYRLLLERFLGGELTAERFQSTYLERFKTEQRRLDEPLFELLDGLFGDVDSFTTDLNLLAENPSFYLDEDRLREKVRDVVKQRLAL
jgi:hypothetical protein